MGDGFVGLCLCHCGEEISETNNRHWSHWRLLFYEQLQKETGSGDLIRFHPWRGAYLFKVTVSVCYLVGG